MNPKEMRFVVFLLAAILILWFSLGYIMPYAFENGLKDSGLSGDTFGAVNALFSGLAFAGIIYTIILQQKDIEQNAVEIRRQGEASVIQQFESTFFHLIQTHNEILKLIDHRSKNGILSTGRDCFKLFYNIFKTSSGSQNPLAIEKSLKYYIEMFEEHEGDLGHYFRNLYHIFLYIDESKVANKNKYIRLIRAQLSSYELALLFYNSLSVYGVMKFKPLIERHAILKNMNWDLIDLYTHLFEYKPSAFGYEIQNLHQVVKLVFIDDISLLTYKIEILHNSFKVYSRNNLLREYKVGENQNETFTELIEEILCQYCTHKLDWIPNTKNREILTKSITKHLVGITLTLGENFVQIKTAISIESSDDLPLFFKMITSSKQHILS